MITNWKLLYSLCSLLSQNDCLLCSSFFNDSFFSTKIFLSSINFTLQILYLYHETLFLESINWNLAQLCKYLLKSNWNHWPNVRLFSMKLTFFYSLMMQLLLYKDILFQTVQIWRWKYWLTNFITACFDKWPRKGSSWTIHKFPKLFPAKESREISKDIILNYFLRQLSLPSFWFISWWFYIK